jgi:hypothetical protein
VVDCNYLKMSNTFSSVIYFWRKYNLKGSKTTGNGIEKVSNACKIIITCSFIINSMISSYSNGDESVSTLQLKLQCRLFVFMLSCVRQRETFAFTSRNVH